MEAEAISTLEVSAESARPEALTAGVETQLGPIDPIYGASPIKRPRRTKVAVACIRRAIQEILEADNPQTVRQVFYALTVRGAIKKVETEYQRTVVRLLVEMREAGDIPFECIADNTRWMRKPTTFVGLDACLRNTANFYRRDLWASMPVYCEVWCEKDALAGVLIEETEPYDVPLMVARGYASISFLHSAQSDVRASPHTFITSAILTRVELMRLVTSRPSFAAMHRTPRYTSSAPPYARAGYEMESANPAD
jgi:hypothetical protein